MRNEHLSKATVLIERSGSKHVLRYRGFEGGTTEIEADDPRELDALFWDYAMRLQAEARRKIAAHEDLVKKGDALPSPLSGRGPTWTHNRWNLSASTGSRCARPAE